MPQETNLYEPQRCFPLLQIRREDNGGRGINSWVWDQRSSSYQIVPTYTVFSVW